MKVPFTLKWLLAKNGRQKKAAASQEWLTAKDSGSHNSRHPKVTAYKCGCPLNMAARQKCLILSLMFLYL